MNGHYQNLSISFTLSIILVCGFLACLWNLILLKPTNGQSVDFVNFSVTDAKRNQNVEENLVKVMIRQQASTPKKTKSSFTPVTISNIQVPDALLEVDESSISPPIILDPTFPTNINPGLNFSVFKSDNFIRRLEEAGAQKGYLTVSLMWNNRNDLDLHCTSPNGEEIYYKNRRGKLGQLDVDMNAGRQNSSRPVENLFFPRHHSGKYSVSVNHYENKGSRDPTDFVLLVREEGKKAKRIRGKISSGNPKKEILAFHIQ